jgi:curved DNA-binding protein CbpA
MMQLNAAWEVLGNPLRRLRYDDTRRRTAQQVQQADASAKSASGGIKARSAIHVEPDPQGDAAPATPIRSAPKDPSVIDFGHYEGRSIAELARTDPDYLLWLARTPAGRRYAPDHVRLTPKPAVATTGRARR